MNDASKITTIDELLQCIDDLLYQEITLLGTWILGEGDQRPPQSISRAMQHRIEYLQEQKKRFKNG
jgi:hypothetical protein